jgi:aspartyl-tRNA synthetase
MKRITILEAASQVGKKVKLAGWVDSYRDHGGIIFVDLRDISGLMQVVLPKNFQIAKDLRNEWVIEVEGEVKERPEKMVNPKLATGKVEFKTEKVQVLSSAETLPFSVSGDGYEINEETRLRYRYLDLRRPRLKNNLITRQKVENFIRSFLNEYSFIEVETPILTKSTPEGARDFLVPSRIYPGNFYALPQSPQQYKQLLMVAGLEKYFQIARCFRDEDTRADRQAEFTQLDLEMSFVEQDDVLDLMEKMMIGLIEKHFPKKHLTKKPFPRLSYQEVMEKHNSDRPDLRSDPKDTEELAFAFVLDFPMFEKTESREGWSAVHHPFTRPQTDSLEEIKNHPEEVKAYQYDLVLNGQEIGGGSLRSYKGEVLKAVFEVLGHSQAEIEEKFGHLLKAFQYGVPPHGGIALGLERLLAVLLGEKSIREVIPFPKTGDSRGLMMGTPSDVSQKQLEELGLKKEKEDSHDKKN